MALKERKDTLHTSTVYHSRVVTGETHASISQAWSGWGQEACHCSSVCQEKLHEETKEGSGVTKFAERGYIRCKVCNHEDALLISVRRLDNRGKEYICFPGVGVPTEW